MAEDNWLRGKKDIANYLGVGTSALRKMYKKHGGFPARFDGRLMVAKKTDIDIWLTARTKRVCMYDLTPCLK